MKRDRTVAAVISSIVVATTLAGLGVFLYFGSGYGVIALVVGVPAVVILGTVLYVRDVAIRPGGSATEYTKQKGRTAGDALRAFNRELQERREQFPGWEPSELSAEFEHLCRELDDEGVSFDPSSNAYDLSVRNADPGRLDELAEDAEALDSELEAAFGSFARSERERLERLADELADAGLADGQPIDADSAADSDDPAEQLSAVQSELRDRIERSLARLDGLADEGATGDSTDRIETARDALADDRLDDAVEAVLAASNRLEAELSSQLETERDSLASVLETVRSSEIDAYVEPSLRDELDRLETELDELASVLALDELDELRTDVRSVCTEIVSELESELAADLDTLSSSPVPRSFYDRPPAADESFADELTAATTIEEYRDRCDTAVEALGPALSAVSEKAAIAETYPAVSDEIDDELRSTGSIAAEELPVTDPEPFMTLYAEENPSATYERSRSRLVAEQAGESYELMVQARFEESGRERDVDVAVSGDATEHSRSLTTTHLDSVEFDDLPYGEYTVTVSSPETGYGSESETIQLDDDRRLGLVVPEVQLREELCAGVETEAEETLPDVAPLFEERFEDEEYLSTAMEFPFAEEYIPCLLALWAEQEGLTTRREDEVLVFDESRLESRLSNIVEHNLDPGERIAFETIRDRYLSVPASDDLIETVLAESAVASEIERHDDELEHL